MFSISDILPTTHPYIHVIISNRPANLTFRNIPSNRRFGSFILNLCGITNPNRPLNSSLVRQTGSVTDPLDVVVLISLAYAVYPRAILTSRHVTSLGPTIHTRTCSITRFPRLESRCNTVDIPYVIVGHNNRRAIRFNGGDVPRVLSLVNT